MSLRPLLALVLVAAASSALLVACTASTSRSPAAARVAKEEPIQPIVAAVVTDSAKVELGKRLYFDPRLSLSGFISCNSCHNLSMGGSDNLPTSIGHNWKQGPINSPTVLNSSLNLAQFWDGRAKDLKEQAGGPIANPGEMAFTHNLAVGVLRSIPQYVDGFKTVYGHDTLSIDQVTDAIAAFEETLVTPGSRFDEWLYGDEAALTVDEVAGYTLFKESGCAACHHGPAAGGSSFQRMGLVAKYDTRNPSIGRAAVTGQDADRMTFKVPTLRNVELTYPYFHDGAAATLESAVTTMGRIQLGREYTPEETAKLVAFLKSLTGTQPSFPLPMLPPSTSATPPPRPFTS